MTVSDQRLSDRVPFRASLRILTRVGTIDAGIDDLSRTGLGIRLPLDAIDPAAERTLAGAAASVQRRLSHVFDVELNPELLGSLLRKRVVVVRFGSEIDSDGTILLGCRFEEPLSRDETIVLGVPMPPTREEEADWLPRADVPAPHVRQSKFKLETRGPRLADLRGDDPDEAPGEEPAPRKARPARTEAGSPGSRKRPTGRSVNWRAYLTGTREDATPIFGHADRISPDGVVLRVQRDPRKPLDAFDAPDVVSAILAFTQTYGQELGLKLTAEAEHLWTGPTVLTHMTLPQETGSDALLMLRFGRQLRPAELRRLGLERDER